MPLYQDDCHPDAEHEITRLGRAGRYLALGQLLALINEVIEHGLPQGEQPAFLVNVPNGYGLFERCAPQMFGVFTIERTAGQQLLLRLLAVDTTANAARLAGAARV